MSSTNPHRGPFTRLADRLLILGGGHPAIAAHCPTERPRLVRSGLLICSAALMASLSMAIALRMILRAPLRLDALGGLVWGTCIIAPLDAYLVTAVRRQSNPLLTVLTAAPRLLLALVIAATVAVPITLGIFHSEIAHQVENDNQAALAADERQINRDPNFAAIPQLRRQVAQLEQTVATGADAPPAATPAVTRLQARVDKLRSEYLAAAAKVGCELDGLCGTHRPGAGPEYQADVLARGQYRDLLAGAQRRLAAAQAAATGAARRAGALDAKTAAAQLPILRAELVSDVNAQRNAVADARLLGHADGLAARIKALAELSRSNTAVGSFHTLVVLLLVGLEASPVLNKMLLLLGRKTPYEEHEEKEATAALALRDGELADEAAAERRIRQVRIDARVDADADVSRHLYGIYAQRTKDDIDRHPERYLA